MNRLMMIAVAGFMALLLTACGDKDESKPADTTSTTTVTTPADGAAPADGAKTDDAAKGDASH